MEFRKLVDTRSGTALLAAAAILAGVFGGGAALTADARTDFGRIALLAGVPGGLILMVLAVLLVTSEHTTRTVSVTFTLAASFADGVSGVEVAKLATSLACWVLIPGAIGTLRTLRGDLS